MSLRLYYVFINGDEITQHLPGNFPTCEFLGQFAQESQNEALERTKEYYKGVSHSKRKKILELL